MTREEILSTIQDLILSLRLGHVENIKQKWQEKKIRLDNAMFEMSEEDKQWIDNEYKKWHKEKIEPLTKMQFPHL